jgi:hypothetical protein
MSYDVAVVEPPVPLDDAEAWQALDEWVEAEQPRSPAFQQLHDLLVQRFPDDAEDGVWGLSPLVYAFDYRAAVLNFRHSRAAEVLPFVVENARALGLVVFDWQSEQIYRGDGIPGLTLEIEDQHPIQAPSLQQIAAAVDRLSPDRGPGFLIVEAPDNSYAQCAGGGEAYCAEWRQYSGDRFAHFVAGRPEVPFVGTVAIPTHGFQVTVRSNERLSASDVKTILQAFATGRARPPEFTWRETTHEYL